MNAMLGAFFIPSCTQTNIVAFVKRMHFFPLIMKPWFSYFGNISVVTSRNSKYLRKFALLFNIENFDSWGNFLIIHPSESKLVSFSSLHQEKLQYNVRFLSWLQNLSSVVSLKRPNTYRHSKRERVLTIYYCLLTLSKFIKRTGTLKLLQKEQSINGKCCINECCSGCFKASRILIKAAPAWLGESLPTTQMRFESSHVDLLILQKAGPETWNDLPQALPSGLRVHGTQVGCVSRGGGDLSQRTSVYVQVGCLNVLGLP